MYLRLRILIILSLWLGFGLRLWGLAFGLPYEFHPDEHKYVNAALNWYNGGELRLEFVNPPLYTYLLVLAYGLWFGLSPFAPTPAEISGAYLFARGWSLAFGMLTVALAYPLGRRLSNQKVGLLALIWLSGLFLPAREAHFAVNDATAAFFVMLALYFSLGLFQKARLRTYGLAGLAVGLATATKLTAGLVLVAPVLAHSLASANNAGGSPRAWLRSLRQPEMGLCLGTALGVYLLISGHIFWQFPAFVEAILEHLHFGAEGYKGLQMSPAGGWIFYLKVLGWGMGWPMLLAGLVGIILVFRRSYHPGFPLAGFSLLFFAYMGGQKILFARFLLPVIPPLVLLAALALVWGAQKWSVLATSPGRGQRGYLRLIYPLLVAGLWLQPLASLIWFDYLLTLPDTRQVATEWLKQNLAEDTVITRESYSLLPNTLFLPQDWPYKIITLDERGPTRNNPDYYLSHKTEFIALSNFTFGRVRQESQEEAARHQQLATLEERATLIKTFNPYRRPDYDDWFYLDQLYGPAGEILSRLQPGPLIRIYRLPYENQPHSLIQPAISTPVQANFGGKLTLLGYDLPSRRAPKGGAFPLTLYWRAEQIMDQTYVIFNRLLDQQQQPWGGYDRWPQETARTTLWHPGEVVIDTFNLPIAAKAPDGIYTIDLGLYDQADPTAAPLPLWREGQPIDQHSVRIGPVKVGGGPPDLTLSHQAVTPQTSWEIHWGEPAVILGRGYDLTWLENALHLTLYWESLAQTSTDWSLFVHLRNERDELIAQKDGPVGGGNYPTSLWDPGEVIADIVEVTLPEDHLVADYRIVIGLYELQTGQRLAIPGYPANEIVLDVVDE